MRRRDLLRMLLSLVAAPALLPLGSQPVLAQESPPGGASDDQPAEPMLPSGSQPAPSAAPPAPPVASPGNGASGAATAPAFPAPLPGEIAQGPIPNNIVGLNVARLHQPLYIWAASDLVNANGGDWGYLTVVWTMQDREAPMADYNLQLFLDRCFELHVQPIVRVATRFEARREPTVPGQPAVKPNPQGAEDPGDDPESEGAGERARRGALAPRAGAGRDHGLGHRRSAGPVRRRDRVTPGPTRGGPATRRKAGRPRPQSVVR